MNAFTDITKALSDPNRVRALMAVRDQELCVCRLIELLQLAPSTVSKHLTILKQAGLIESRKEGRWMHYQLPKKPSLKISHALNWVFTSLDDSAEIKKDRQRMARIIQQDVGELCAVYKK